MRPLVVAIKGSTVLRGFTIFPTKGENTFGDKSILQVKRNYFVRTRLEQGDHKEYWETEMETHDARYAWEIRIKKYDYVFFLNIWSLSFHYNRGGNFSSNFRPNEVDW